MLTSLLSSITLVETPTRLYPGGARNLGIIHSSAPYVAFLAADCVATEGWLERRLAAHAAGHQTVASALLPMDANVVSYASYSLIHGHRRPETPPSEANRFGLSYSRDIFQRHGMFDEQVRIGEDSQFNSLCEQEATSVWDREIITLHSYPTTMKQALTDQYRRGQRAASYASAYQKRSPLRLAIGRARRVLRVAVQTRRPLMVPLFLGYAVGALLRRRARQE